MQQKGYLRDSWRLPSRRGAGRKSRRTPSQPQAQCRSGGTARHLSALAELKRGKQIAYMEPINTPVSGILGSVKPAPAGGGATAAIRTPEAAGPAGAAAAGL